MATGQGEGYVRAPSASANGPSDPCSLFGPAGVPTPLPSASASFPAPSARDRSIGAAASSAPPASPHFSVVLPGPRSRGTRPETQRVRPASAGPSGARTQEGRIAVALFGRPRTQPREASAAARRARGVLGRVLRSGAGGSRRHGASPGPAARTARARSTHLRLTNQPTALSVGEGLTQFHPLQER